MASIVLRAPSPEEAAAFAAAALEYVCENKIDVRVGLGVGIMAGTVTLEGTDEAISHLQVLAPEADAAS